jgi:histidyl-tRNA synthetase
MIALRPELTPSLARMVAMRSKTLLQPIRWWSFGPFWRYERPQRGRTREFFQWNIDLLGVDSPQADAELAAVAATFFRTLGLQPTDIRILVNNRRLADSQLAGLGVPASDRQAIFRLIDRRDKSSAQAWANDARELGLDPSQLAALQAMLEDMDAWRQSEELVGFFEAAESLGVDEYLAYEPSVIRGLDYYTGTVFEARDAAGKYRAILGGGRYDNLVAEVGGAPLPGVGFAMGDVVLGLVLEAYGARPSLRASPADVLVPTFDPASMKQALQLAAELRAAGLRVEWFPEPARLAKQFKYADRQAIPLVAILGPDEIEAGLVAIKDLRTGNQDSVPRPQAVARIRSLLTPQSDS